ncbi:MAG: aldolase/citrate lyase family protein, partial [Aureliella sp.]
LGIANASEIYAQPGCDAIFIGPNDLTFQMRQPDGTFPTDDELETAITQVVDAGRQAGTPTGMHVLTVEQVEMRVAQGMQFIAVSSDLGMLASSASSVSKALGLAAQADIARY